MRSSLATVLLVFNLTWPCPASGQETAQLAGRIWDASEAVVPLAAITAVSDETGFRQTTRSGNDGFYSLVYLKPGRYKITVRKDGFRTLVEFGIKIDSFRSTRVDFHLQIGNVAEVITVNASPEAGLGPSSPFDSRIGRDWIDQVPLRAGNPLPLLEFAPGSIITPANEGEAGQFTVNGQRPNMNYFTVDGVSANTGVGGGLPAQLPGSSLPNMTAFGTFHDLSSINSIDELQLSTSTVSSTRGRSPGGQVELSSRSGTNSVHGLLFDALENQVLDANDWYANREGLPRSPLRLQDLGATLGGPIRRDRTFFFLSYERLRLEQPFIWQASVPSIDAREAAPPALKTILNVFPLPNGPDLGNGVAGWTGTTSHPAAFDGGSARIDHAISSHLLLFARYGQTPSSTQFGFPQIDAVKIESRTVTLGLDASINPRFGNEFRSNWTLTSADSAWRDSTGYELSTCYSDVALLGATAPCASFYRLAIDGVGQLVAGTDASNGQRQWNLSDSIRIAGGRHEVHMGADYRHMVLHRGGPDTAITITAASVPALANSDYTISISDLAQQDSLIEQTSLFVEDAWRVTPRLTLTSGLRWELDPAPDMPPPLTIGVPVQMSVKSLPIWAARYSNLAPHAGLAYRLSAEGRTILRAAFGRYFDPSFGATTDGINGAPYNTWQFNGPSSYGGTGAPSASLVTYAFDKNLHLPSTWEWNISLERRFSGNDTVSLAYVGAAGTSLLRRNLAGDSSALSEVVMATNDGASRYSALQAEYRRDLAKGLQIIASYSWSHSLDNGSSDSAIFWAPSTPTLPGDWASSDFDIRHSFRSVFSYAPQLQSRFGRNWNISGIFRARTGFPVNVVDSETAFGLSFANAFRPDLVPGVPIWLLNSGAPGGRSLNPAAFSPVDGVQGTLGRNAIRGFGMSQLDLALQRAFPLRDGSSLELRAEVSNVLNQPMFADPVRFLSSALFGQSTSMLNLMLGGGTPSRGEMPALQVGGPRSVQVVVRLKF